LISLYVNGKATLQGPSSHTAPFHADFRQDLTPGKNVIAIGSLAVRNFPATGGRNAIAAHGVIELRRRPARRIQHRRHLESRRRRRSRVAAAALPRRIRPPSGTPPISTIHRGPPRR
jgi:hypothetical protein